MSTETPVQLHWEGAVAHVVLDRPEKGNLVSHAMITRLAEILGEASTADVLVIRANGSDFSLGRDQSERPQGVAPEAGLKLISAVNERLAGFTVVSVALVQGRALGFGSGLAMQCDITVAGENAVFGFDEIRHGFPPLIVETYLTRYVPRKAALDLVLTGRSVAAAEARALGMVSRVVPEGTLESEGQAICAELVNSDSSALRRAKEFLDEIDTVPPPERLAHGVGELVSWRSRGG